MKLQYKIAIALFCLAAFIFATILATGCTPFIETSPTQTKAGIIIDHQKAAETVAGVFSQKREPFDTSLMK